jgi:hypothetical protein
LVLSRLRFNFAGYELFDCDLRDESIEEGGELFFCVAARLHDLFVVDFLVEDAGCHVGYERKSEDFEAHVTGYDDLVDGGHADEVGAEGAEGADLGWGLEAGAEDGEVDAFGEEKLLSGCLLDGEGAEFEAVGVAHVEEALACAGDHGEAGLVGAEGGVGSGEVDVVGDGDERALLQVGADASCCVGDDEGLAAEETEDAGGEGDLGDGIALIGVDAALHDGYCDPSDCAQDEVAGVTHDGRPWEVWDVGIGDARGVFDVGGEVPKAGAEDDADRWEKRRPGMDEVGGGLGLAVDVGHRSW